jgi:hypothetical protein
MGRMRCTRRHLLRRRHGLPVALWLLLLLTANALQVVSATHWHSTAVESAAGSAAAPHLPLPDGIDHDGCLLCQVAAQAGTGAPPPAPWILFTVVESHAAALQVGHPAAAQPRPSHAWQGRAPPRV